MKRKLWLLLPAGLLLVAVGVVFLFNVGSLRAEDDRQAMGKLLEELGRERQALDARKAELDDQASQLRVFEVELERRNGEWKTRMDALKKQEDDFTARIEAKAIDRQMIETFESVDPDSAAVLMLKLYGRDAKTAALILRKLSGKKAGKILEAMVTLDAETATSLARETIDAYRPPPAG
jgi:flagellar motility protein MotE (MotC chaperone)